eukprot:1390943-Rhodomonas_salina.2
MHSLSNAQKPACGVGRWKAERHRKAGWVGGGRRGTRRREGGRGGCRGPPRGGSAGPACDDAGRGMATG